MINQEQAERWLADAIALSDVELYVPVMLDEPEPDMADITEVRMWAAGGRVFKSPVGALRHIAKMRLIKRVDTEAAKVYREERGGSFEAVQKRIFKEKYPSSHDYYGRSTFAYAVDEEVRALKAQAARGQSAGGK